MRVGIVKNFSILPGEPLFLQTARNNGIPRSWKRLKPDTFYIPGLIEGISTRENATVKFAIYASNGAVAINSTQSPWVEVPPYPNPLHPLE